MQFVKHMLRFPPVRLIAVALQQRGSRWNVFASLLSKVASYTKALKNEVQDLSH